MRHRHQQEVDELRKRFKGRAAGSAPAQATFTAASPATVLVASPRRVSPATSPLPMDTEMDRTSSQASAGLGSREPPRTTAEPSREALHTLREMGFADEQANRRALQEVCGSLIRSKIFRHRLAVNAAAFADKPATLPLSLSGNVGGLRFSLTPPHPTLPLRLEIEQQRRRSRR